ncbi:type VI secretion system baseplate subunit TssK [Pseudomonas gingeri NCPPB 3146 = LMG 5327]|uniref:Type VI secretion system baseplate subunit TssK n=2 Tax=Pseudomonas gingeri TaxID=117681 RepID=A0A7Y7Y774_9PSED|nr:type VI secretion system baseplate subunit TssK [Pseudomonas gingeri]NWC17842.1 type VI secretion system baseplate subunit TssK [Pseudomonas gingeri]PNQ94115.1 type VI secretion system baseplate subunit TssK [Pseudomonas gingeri NCPPB 3146 = LMG 5327]
MSSRHPVIWHEGLFVKPQHFQQQARAAEAAVQQRLNSLNETLYGFSELQLNTEYLSFGKVAITHARGIMPDGSVFDIPNDLAPPPPLEIADSSAINQVVYLTLPLKSDGTLEVRWPDQYANSRYVAKRQEVRDTHSVDGDQVMMDLAVPNLQLMLASADRSAFTGIALGRILDKRPDGSLLMDEQFYPTSVSLQAVPALRRYLGEITGLMRERAKHLAERIGSPGQSGVADVTDFNLLQTLNRLFPLFQHLSRQGHVHPAQLYLAFAQACGELVTFTDDGRLPEEYPAYQHDSLRESFKPLEHSLRRALATVPQPRAVSLPIEAQQYGVMSAALNDKRLLDNAEFILAVRAKLPLETLRQQLPKQIKISSTESLSQLISLQLPGIPLLPLPVAPRHLPFHAGFSYFELDRHHPAWQSLASGTGFGFHITGELPELELQFWAIRSEQNE